MAHAHLLIHLLLIGFFSPACRVTAVSTNKKSREHLISLRDYDFVGEDPKLKAALAERMAMLQGEVALPDLKEPRTRREPALPDVRPLYQPKADHLQSSLNFPQMVNVSLDYGEFFNVSELAPEMNVSQRLPAPAVVSGGAPAPSMGPAAPGAAPAPLTSAGPAGPEAAPVPDPGADPSPGRDFRRQYYKDPSVLDYNYKIMELMKQCIYGTQLKILELNSIINKHEPDPRYRMAYIFNRLDEWLHNLRTNYYAVRYKRRRVKRVIYYYENALRIDIDITYSIEHLVFLHTEYMKNMDALVPLSQRIEFSQKKKQKQAN